jgi:undecaprenyl-diphosphatase
MKISRQSERFLAMSVLDLLRGYYLIRLLFGLFLAAAVLMIFGWLTTDVLKNPSELFDNSVRTFVQRIATPTITGFLLTMTKLGSTAYLTILGTAVVIIFVVLGWRRELFLFLIAMAGQAILHYSLKAYFQRPRPEAFFDYPIGEGYSYPSGHALASFCFYSVLAWLIIRKVKSVMLEASIWVFASIVIFLIGFSRIYIGVHYPTDVIGGYLSAFIWTVAVAFSFCPASSNSSPANKSG